MLAVLTFVCIILWLPLFFYQIARRGLLILVIWLLIAPIATNLVSGASNPFFTPPELHEELTEVRVRVARSLSTMPQSVTLYEVIRQPTRLIFVAFFVVFFLDSLMRKKHVVSLDRTEIWMGLFSVILLINVCLWSERLAFSLRTAMDTFLIPFLAYYVMRRLVISEGHFRQLTQIIGYLGCCLIVIGIVELIAHQTLSYRLRGPFRGGTIYYYVMMVVFFTVLLDLIRSWYVPKREQALPHGIRLLVLLSTPIMIFLTLSRGNWLGLLSGLWVLLLLGRRLVNPSRKFGMIGMALLLMSVIAISMQLLRPEDFIGAVSARATDAGTLSWRFERWIVAIKTAVQHPVYGIGLNNQRYVFGQELGNYYTTHSHFLTLFAEMGVIGLLSYLAIVASIIRTGLRLYRTRFNLLDQWRGIVVMAVMVAHLVPALFADTLQYTGVMLSYIYVFFGGIAGLYRYSRPLVNYDKLPVARYQRVS